ncbi:hypothetical protein P7K49_021421 [Saguinus oedipus]|uniref:Uncharacterized protein n=1 Tax=Saguinus oedipus TaxID=9490 RepID=A0ABQ9UUB5_SAGOE|nr:hypothetical protein P7K49_021421 [Saguinus oedipus]
MAVDVAEYHLSDLPPFLPAGAWAPSFSSHEPQVQGALNVLCPLAVPTACSETLVLCSCPLANPQLPPSPAVTLFPGTHQALPVRAWEPPWTSLLWVYLAQR